ncbi:hypothetical protein BV25DRAFT_1841438 [Artomyces pyxidatus]|uniref:Uncharacterized protein n=1 Tax=Artomyces pyxidatus TaxID=48021 RepID=A0ACB8SN75_9AGAM|nr:hypothetical protein BV25DRAFT_1841438 [Artomyces pyxidatus]
MTQVVSLCRTTIQSGLDAILFQKYRHPAGSVEINYSNYEGKIVERYGVDLTPWPLEGRIRNPGELKRAEVNRLWTALSGGHCRWAGKKVYKARQASKKRGTKDAPESSTASTPEPTTSSTGQPSPPSLLEDFEAAARTATQHFEGQFDDAAGPPDVAKALAEFNFADFDPTLSAQIGMSIDPTMFGSEGSWYIIN